ncbi:helicase [Clostridium botulinum]|uniref:DNA2/NAM7 helicase-like C-terminal domain-containing protein n=1 Tax=Clostridium botulinum (strain Hall / ATCC 3502 / NCTC 13319 / Type A) TaxID=441771 RepID=A5I3E9_CLOBH|nr:helicase [Clostridium botulinum]AWB17898.1 helicase [Clostridium botulinum]AWB30678.1 helicase [Clostridium botulinum]EGT5614459.1 helicase [Clostridium botulinum]EGT5622512.1 helicase [Clostridium botulinum]EGT5625549.1 helicase [Clostridium botulinum]
MDKKINRNSTYLSWKKTTIVIIYLGVGEDHEGAANWASNSPDILNVAVTRVKNRVIIVGNKKLLGDKEYFKEAVKELSRGLIL